MKQLGRIFSYGFIISFLGLLPLGMMNVTVTHIALTSGVMAGLRFTAGAIVVELIYVAISLSAMELLLKLHGFFRIFEWLTMILLFALSITSFRAAINMRGFDVPIPLDHT